MHRNSRLQELMEHPGWQDLEDLAWERKVNYQRRALEAISSGSSAGQVMALKYDGAIHLGLGLVLDLRSHLREEVEHRRAAHEAEREAREAEAADAALSNDGF